MLSPPTFVCILAGLLIKAKTAFQGEECLKEIRPYTLYLHVALTCLKIEKSGFY